MAEITEDMIGCLCKFWQNDEHSYTIAILMQITWGIAYNKKHRCYRGNSNFYKHCRRLTKEEALILVEGGLI